jgi:arabinan endo-1,5-alpha-L-arabinosidase
LPEGVQGGTVEGMLPIKESVGLVGRGGRACVFLLLTLVAQAVHGADPICHDPSRLLSEPGGLALYCSGEGGEALGSLRLDTSTDVWSPGSSVFPGSVPGWTESIQIWNPTGEFDAPAWGVGGRLYYSVFDEEGSAIQDAIGLAQSTGTGAERTWEDLGVVLRSEGEGEHPRAMDPAIIEDGEGGVWMIFGSHAGGIYLVALDPSTGLLLEHPEDPWADPQNGNHPDRFIHLASYGGSTADENAIEAPFLHRRGNFYYLFVNWDRCCSGANSDYNIRVGRASSIEGPYLDRDGVDMANGGGSLVLDASGALLGDSRYVGPGHAGIYEEGTRDIFTFHYYDASDGGTARVAAKVLEWDGEDWPVVTDEDLVPGGGGGGGGTHSLSRLKAVNLTRELGRQSLVFVSDSFPVLAQDFDPDGDLMQITLLSGELILWTAQIPPADPAWISKGRRFKWRASPGQGDGGLSQVVLSWKASGEGKLKLRAKGAEIDDSDVGSDIRLRVAFGDSEPTFVPDECESSGQGARLLCR